MNNSVGWFEIYVDDMRRAKAFYESVFDVQLSKLEGALGLKMWAFPMQPDNYGAPGALVHMPGFGAGSNSVIVYFSCVDCSVEVAKAKKSGGRIEREKMTIGQNGYIALVVDTEGNMIGLHSMR